MANRSSTNSILEIKRRSIAANMNLVAAARFAASYRLESRSRVINLVLSMLAGSVIITSLLPISFVFSELTVKAVVLVDIFASLFVLILSLYQWSSRDDVNAEKCHWNGMEISDLRKRVELASGCSQEELLRFVAEYGALLRECGVNHEPIDFTNARMVTKQGYTVSKFRHVWNVIMTRRHRIPALAVGSFLVFIAVAWITAYALLEVYGEVGG